jgi:hypothetical protein
MNTVKTRDVTILPPSKNLSRDLNEERILIGVANSHTHPNYGKAKSGWRERRNSSLFEVASSSVWLLHCTLKNLIVLRRVTRSFWSKILTRCSGYVKLASSGATSDSTTFTGAFKHFFNCDTWKISWTHAINGGNSNLYATFPHFSRIGNGPM